MTMLLYLAAVTAGFVAPNPGGGIIMTDIELSEWHPSMRLVLDLETGRYVIRPTAAKWPKGEVRPDPRHGTLAGEALHKVRALFGIAMDAGVANESCVKADGKGFPGIVSNASVPRLSLEAGERRIAAPAMYECWTVSVRSSPPC
ncbi:hypothetical protein QE385_003311 [Sphingomonas sp. SORGH_AS 950]|uniref:hypothetical protein n=1 Tax=Sphingomonas sp. SORGH_AS_0950 TaxID=3041792 RepID=UPI00277F89CC|nr:hypothetical protein [Sphingomonas sp. SORGH_AS_0950]MDQ1158984.1 hypothetical protein [Sphingomonas sp. SORGH_AS_0950]